MTTSSCCRTGYAKATKRLPAICHACLAPCEVVEEEERVIDPLGWNAAPWRGSNGTPLRDGYSMLE